jgi:hypothetical protein
MMVLRELFFFLKVIPTIILGFFLSVWASLFIFLRHWFRKSFLELSSFFLASLQLIFSPMQWISYKVKLLSSEELVGVSSEQNLIFFGFAFFVFLLQFFWQQSWFSYLFFILQSMLSILLLASGLFPSRFLVKFVHREDFFFNPFFWYFSILTSLVFLLSVIKLIIFLKFPDRGSTAKLQITPPKI